MPKILSFIILFCFASMAQSQDYRLANQYYQNGEYEKAAATYQALIKKSPASDYYFQRYIDCKISLQDYKGAEDAIKEQIKEKPQEVQYYVIYGNLYEQQFQEEKAKKQYEKAINNLPPDIGIISKLGNTFQRIAKYDQAILVYEKGSKLLGNEQLFATNLGNLYLKKGDIPKMIYYHLNSATANPNKLRSLETTFARTLVTDENYDFLKTQLYERIQGDSENNIYPELLEWVFIKQKEYNKALRQARALDRKLEENGTRVIKLANIAMNDKDYDTAMKAYQYIIDEKGKQSSYYIESRKNLLNARKLKTVGNFDYTQSEIDSLSKDYLGFIKEFGLNNQSAELVTEYAEFLARYMNDLNGATEILSELVVLKSVDRNTTAKAKISLADYYLMQGEIWESTLLYSQVDKDFKEEFLGELARFRNAKLSYYNGDFEWAQEQFNILKAATSRLISNDAIDLSVLIMDNLGLDTTTTALYMYAQSDMLAFQNKFDEAFSKLDSILEMFPKHSLEDDVLYSKANLFVMLKDFDQAVINYQKIIDNFPEEIRCDNAIYELAELYNHRLDDKEKAKELYEKLFIDYSNSTFALDARKKFRALRGDDI